MQSSGIAIDPAVLINREPKAYYFISKAICFEIQNPGLPEANEKQLVCFAFDSGQVYPVIHIVERKHLQEGQNAINGCMVYCIYIYTAIKCFPGLQEFIMKVKKEKLLLDMLLQST